MSSSSIEVSVITITYGHQNTILDTIKGVLSQKFNGSIQFIIADDHSPDKTEENTRNFLATHIKPSNVEIQYHKHAQNIGMLPNFIWALNQAKGKYIALCDGDDYWTDPYKLQKQIDKLESQPECVLCFHDVKILQTNGEIVDDFITHVPERYETCFDLARSSNYIHTPSVVFRNEIKQYPKEFSFSPIGDFFLYLLLVQHGNITRIQEPMAVYRYGVGVFTSQNNIRKPEDSIKLYGLLLSQSNNPEINSIYYDKLIESIKYFEKQVRAPYIEKPHLIRRTWSWIKRSIFNLKNK